MKNFDTPKSAGYNRERDTQKNHESILARKEIREHPPGFVSVFHETKKEYLSEIDIHGLLPDSENKNLRTGDILVMDALYNEYVPEGLRFSIDRNVSYGYPSLDRGFDFGSGSVSFQKRLESTEKSKFFRKNRDLFHHDRKKYEQALEQHLKKVNTLQHLRQTYGEGEVLELKVDPEQCYIGNHYIIDNLGQYSDTDFNKDEGLRKQKDAQIYWKSMLTLKDFLQWYAIPKPGDDMDTFRDIDRYKEERSSEGEVYRYSHAFKDAPGSIPSIIEGPEVLIPHPVPQQYIRVLNEDDVPPLI